jgi:hypothetical protein
VRTVADKVQLTRGVPCQSSTVFSTFPHQRDLGQGNVVEEVCHDAMHTTLHSLLVRLSLFPSRPPSHVAGQEDVLGTSSQLSVVIEVEVSVLRTTVALRCPCPELAVENEPAATRT